MSTLGTLRNIVRLSLERFEQRLEEPTRFQEAIRSIEASANIIQKDPESFAEASYQNSLRDKLITFTSIQNTLTGSIPYSDFSQLQRTLALTREVYRADEHIQRGSEIWQNFITGTGLVFTVETESESTQEAIQSYIDTWIEENDFPEIQCQTIARDIRDGETFLRSFITRSGVSLRFIEPEYICNDMGADSTVILGIKVAPNDTGTVEAYYVKYPGQVNAEVVPANEIYHSIQGDMGGSLRGFPKIWPVIDNAYRATGLLSNISTCARTRAAFGFVASAKTGTNRTALEQMITNKANYTTTNSKGITERVVDIGGVKGIYNVAGDMEYQFPSANMNVGDLLTAYKQEVHSIAACFGVQYAWISQDSSEANRASMESASEPSYKMFQRLQLKYGNYFKPMIEQVVAYGMITGAIPTAQYELTIDYPSLIARDYLKEAQAYQIYLSQGLLSKQTILREMGYDPEQEQENIDETFGAMPRVVQPVNLRDDEPEQDDAL